MILAFKHHSTGASDLVRPDTMRPYPSVPITPYRDGFGNSCIRLVAPQGRILITADAVVNDTGMPDAVSPWAEQGMVPELPEETLTSLLGSRYCETDRLSETAWTLFRPSPAAWGPVRAVSHIV